jgi:hypothetical protein
MEQINKASPEALADNKTETEDWEAQLRRLHELLPHEQARNKLRDEEIPTIEQQIRDEDEKIPVLADKAEEVTHFNLVLLTIGIYPMNTGSSIR